MSKRLATATAFGLVLGALTLGTGSAIADPGGTTVYDYTGTAQTYTVPAGIGSLQVTVLGAQGGLVGGDAGSAGNGGGSTSGTIAVSAGETLTLYVGQAGQLAASAWAGGGAAANSTAAGGGGGSFVVDQDAQLLLAAGGGGGAASSTAGGQGGGAGAAATPGADGAIYGLNGSGDNDFTADPARGGQPGTADGNGSGGAGWCSCENGAPGSGGFPATLPAGFPLGGVGGNNDVWSGGGGGGGYFAGGGGGGSDNNTDHGWYSYAGGGAGGAGYAASSVTDVSGTAGANVGTDAAADGQISVVAVPAPVVPPQTVTVTAHSLPASVTVGRSVHAKAVFSLPGGGRLVGKTVRLYKRVGASSTWKVAASTTTGPKGGASVDVKVSSTTRFQWRYAGSTAYTAVKGPSQRVAAAPGVKVKARASRTVVRLSVHAKGIQVTVRIDGRKVGVATTNKLGVVKVHYSALTKGSHTVKVRTKYTPTYAHTVTSKTFKV